MQGRRAVVVYAPRHFTNRSYLYDRGAFVAVVDLTTGAVTKLNITASLAYYNPGCGTGETAVLTQSGVVDLGKTRLHVLDTTRGVLTRSQGRESVVATPGASDLVKLLQFRVSRRDVSLGHILAARIGLEVTGARRAAELATPEQVADIRAEFEALAATKKENGYHAADIRLHRAIAVASANPLIVLILVVSVAINAALSVWDRRLLVRLGNA